MRKCRVPESVCSVYSRLNLTTTRKHNRHYFRGALCLGIYFADELINGLVAYGCPLQLGRANGFIANGDVTKVPILEEELKSDGCEVAVGEFMLVS